MPIEGKFLQMKARDKNGNFKSVPGLVGETGFVMSETEPANKKQLWLDTSAPRAIIVPTWGEHQALTNKVNQAFTSASKGKTLLASALAGKGVTIDPESTFAEFAASIATMPSGGADLGSVKAYIADFGDATSVVATNGAVDRYWRRLIS